MGDTNSLTPKVGACLACMSRPSVPPYYRQNVSGLSEGLTDLNRVVVNELYVQ